MDKTDSYIEKINAVMDYIEAHLEQPISLEQLAHVACLSKFHFHRVFQAFTEESLYAFITRLRVERAGAQLLTHSETITEIALACGFNDSATFARAFKQHFGVSASMWRKNSKNHQDTIKQSTYRERRDIQPLSITQTHLDAWHVAYYRHTGAYAGDSDLFATLYQKLMQWSENKGIVSEQTVAIYHDAIDITANDKLRLSLGLIVPPDTLVGGEIGRLTLQGDYLICHYVLGNHEYGHAWQQVYRQIIPEWGLQPTQGYAFERYLPNCYDSVRDQTAVAICVPVEPL